MKMIKFFVALNLITIVSLYGACDDITARALRTKKGTALLTYIENIGYEVFGGKETLLFKGGLANLLDKNPKITSLAVTGQNNKEIAKMKPWYLVTECCKNLTNDLLKTSQDIQRKDIYTNTYLKIESTTQKLVLFSKFFDLKRDEHTQQQITTLETNITNAINDISPIYLFSLHELPMPVMKRRMPQEVINEYKKMVRINFDLANLINLYKKTKQELLKKGKTIAPQELFYFLVASKVLAKTEHDILENQQYTIKLFVTMLEELIYQSKYYQQGWFWQKHPSGTLNKEQISLAQEMINKLYSAFPAMETQIVLEKIKTASDSFKAPLMLFAQTKVLLIVLRAYLRKLSIK